MKQTLDTSKLSMKREGLKSKTFMLIYGIPPLDSRVGVSRMSMAWEFLFSRDASIESSPLLKTMFGWLEGHVLSSSEGDNGMNGVTNFTSPNGSLLG